MVSEEGGADLPTIYSQPADSGSNKRERESGAWEGEQNEDDVLLNMFLWELDWDILFAAIMQRRVYEPQRSSQKENNMRAV